MTIIGKLGEFSRSQRWSINNIKVGELRKRIGIVMVLTNSTNPDFYRTAIDTVDCYSRIHEYQFLLVTDSDYDCPQADKFFRRHCVVAKLLPEFDTILFLDADIGVVNPNKKIEEFIDDNFDLIFYDRFYNWEIMAGSYIVKNTEYSKNLLEEFANYEKKLPKSFHGTDNGAIHMFLAEKLFPQSEIEIEICRKIWNQSKSFKDLFTYEACIKNLFGTGIDFGKIRILHKGTAWVRDAWLTNTIWSPDIDFMLHGWKTKQLSETPTTGTIQPIAENTARWFYPFVGTFDLKKCSPSNSTWSYNSNLIGSQNKIQKSLKEYETKVSKQKLEASAKILNFL